VEKVNRIRRELSECDQLRKERAEKRLLQCIRNGRLSDARVALALLSKATLRESARQFASDADGWPLAYESALESWWAARSDGIGIGKDEVGRVLTVFMATRDYPRARDVLTTLGPLSDFSAFAVALSAAALGVDVGSGAPQLPHVYRAALEKILGEHLNAETIVSLLEEQLSQSFLDDPDDARFVEFDGPVVIMPLGALLVRSFCELRGTEFPAVSHPLLSGPVWSERWQAEGTVSAPALKAFVELASRQGLTDL